MAASLQRRVLPFGRALLAQARSFSSEALVELKPGEVGIVSGIPQEHLKRKVMIYSPARTATQQGSGKVGKWKINFLSTQKWENPLMGWTSTGDPYANVGDAALSFSSEEAAKAFAEKHGWQYVVRKRHTPLLKPKSYAENFKWKGPPKTAEAPKTVETPKTAEAPKKVETPQAKTAEATKAKEAPKPKEAPKTKE